MNKAIIVGASSGIGRELAKFLSKNNYIVGMAARRVELLSALKDEIQEKSFIKQIDVSRADEAVVKLYELIEEMHGVDVAIITAGVYSENPDLDWNLEKDTIDINVKGFCAVVNVFYKYFLIRGSGHIVGISSIASHRGSSLHTSYSASKAFVSNYLEGLQKKVRKEKTNIHVTNIEPGYVDTPMISGLKNTTRAIGVEEATLKIFKAIQKKKEHVYITRRLRVIVWMRKVMPGWLYRRIST